MLCLSVCLLRQHKLEEVERHETLPHHPNCLGFVNAWEERGLLYIQTELCQMRSASLCPSPSPHLSPPSLSLSLSLSPFLPQSGPVCRPQWPSA